MLGRVHRGAIQVGDRLASEDVDLGDALDLVAPHLDANALLLVRREDLDCIAAHTERSALKGDIVTTILNSHEGAQNLVAGDALTLREGDHLLLVLHRIAEAINRGNSRDNDDVVTLHEA